MPARTLAFSKAESPSFSVYPDSDKVGIFSDDPAADLIFRRETAVPYSDREEGWERAD
jgi:hypothetical protein